MRDLRKIAPPAWDLYTAVMERVQDALRELEEHDDELVIHVALAKNKAFTLPWSLLYDLYIDHDVPPAKLTVCRSVTEKRALADAVASGAARCPWQREPWHFDNVLCPFGFLGFRYRIEQLVSADRATCRISFAGGTHVAVGLTEANVDRKKIAAHVERLRAAFRAVAPAVDVRDTTSKSGLRELLEVDLPLVYFLCHGTRDKKEKTTALGIGKRDRVTPKDIDGWVNTRWKRDRTVIWDDPRPLVFINACESVAIEPSDLVTYAGTLVGTAHAAGLIGTEVRVDQNLAMELAEMFFARLLEPEATVGDALLHVRRAFLADGNLFGLVYTPFCIADTAVAAA